MNQADRAIPVTILTGFLGAGKTTLLNRILNGNHGLRIAVLVNDFGSINIDSELIIGVEDGAISLSNGCVCCNIRDDLINTIEFVIKRPEKPEYILLEASGVADPSNIAFTFIQPDFRDILRLDSIISIIDADQFFTYREYPGIVELKLRQIGFSDMVILNKIDLVDDSNLQMIKTWISSRMNRVRTIEAIYCYVPLEILLSVGRFDPTKLENELLSNQPESHHNSFSTWSYVTEYPFSADALREMVKKNLPNTVYRCKGIIYVSDNPSQKGILQVVGRRTDISFGDIWDNCQPKTQIVAIGSSGGIDPILLQEQFDACIDRSSVI